MKLSIKVAAIVFYLFIISNVAKAQTKIGYVYFSAILDVMPERAKLAKDLQAYQKTFVDRLQVMQAEYQKKVDVYQKTRTTMTDAVRIQSESELTDMQKRIQDYSTQAQQQSDAKQNELAKPLLGKIKLAIDAVAKLKGYTYIIDATTQVLIVMPAADNITAAVKLKLGIVAPGTGTKK
ncbi:OmpH family outer membrane protein [Mucilaginibacter sp. HMF5004]|uniref:OmpH family outer membrane protein n=1 Tax=Mucilaginibacter rivuli TaxID=2857527 RepID=UPI001C5CF050|nr:OmpH family outer membrane protein [Mucilaginibacter rivuli]MBW4889653.1 OmpH family outer membrane protein [Mucilaginibacter rivuli]